MLIQADQLPDATWDKTFSTCSDAVRDSRQRQNWMFSPQISGSQPGLVLPPRGHLAKSQWPEGELLLASRRAGILLNSHQCIGQSPQQRTALPHSQWGRVWKNAALDKGKSILLGGEDSRHRVWPPGVSSIREKWETVILGDQSECGTYHFPLKKQSFTKTVFLSLPNPEL